MGDAYDMKTTKGAYESEISKAITQWEKDFLGRGSLSVKTDILRDMIIVSLQAVWTQAKYKVCETHEGLLTIKRTRSKLEESGIEALDDIIYSITAEEVKGFHTD